MPTLSKMLNNQIIYMSPEYNVPHFRGIIAAGLSIKNVIVLRPIRFLLRGVLRLKASDIALVLQSFRLFLRLTSARQTVVISCLPNTRAVLLLSPILKRHHVILYTSYADWAVASDSNSFVSKRVRRILQESVDQVVGISDAATLGFQSYLQRELRAVTIPHAVDMPPRFRMSASNPPTGDLKLINLYSKPRLLYVGRLTEEKGLEDLVELTSVLQCEITVCGQGELESRVKRHPRLRWLGQLRSEALRDVYRNHDVLLLPSKTKVFSDGLIWRELFGLVVVEALSAGCCVFASSHPGPIEIQKSCPINLFSEDTFVVDVVRALRVGIYHSHVDSLRGLADFQLESVERKWRNVLSN